MSQEETPRKKHGCLGCLGRVAVVTVLLVAIVVFATGRILPGVIKSQAESIGSELLGTPVTIGGVSLSLFAGKAELRNITVQNYEGFSEPNFLSIENAGGDVSLLSLLIGRLVVDRVWVERTALALEVNRSGSQNLAVLLAALAAGEADEEATEDSGEPEPPAPFGATPPVLVRKVEIRDVRINFIDDFASSATLTSSFVMESLAISDLKIPSLDDRNATGVMAVTVNSVALRAPEHFSQPTFLASTANEVRLDIGRLVATLAGPERLIDIISIDSEGTTVVLETIEANEYDPMPQVLREFMVIAMNTSVPGEPRTFAQINDEAKNAKESRRRSMTAEEQAQASQAAVAVATSLAQGDQQAAAEAAGLVIAAEEASAEEIINQILIGKVAVRNFNFENINAPDPSQNIRVLHTSVDFNQFAWPHQPGLISDLVVRTQLLDDQGKISLKVRGELMKAMDGARLDIGADVVNQQLAGLPEVAQGRLYATLEMVVENRRALGELRFRTVDFRFAPGESRSNGSGGLLGTFAGLGRTVGKTTVETSLAAQQRTNAPPFVVPINYSLDDITVADISRGLMLAITQNVAGALEAGLRGITGTVTDFGSAAAGAVSDGINRATDAIGTVGEGANRATREVDGAIRGLLGRNRRDQE